MISRIIKVEVKVISRSLTSTLTILDIIKTVSNNCLETCGLLLLYNNSEDARNFHEFTGTINHS